MKTEQIGASAALVGLLMLIAAMIWPAVDNPRREWSDEDAKAYQETVARVHVSAYLQADSNDRPRMHGEEPVDPERILQHREDIKTLERLKTKLDSARERPARIAGILKWSGAGLVAVGVVVLLAGRSRNA